MELTRLRSFLLTLPGAQEDTPFGPEILVYRIAGKMFALLDWQAEPLRLNLKCEPELALLLRELHPEVKPGWHMNKLLCQLCTQPHTHWPMFFEKYAH
ncbi:MmcQ/YjbR family DNA-binding protein [Aeromonas hydrophila]|uniref:MmcQ/YjbR family DNA-binding protein n=1 Tax=Aeromonas hydrophila TaxID=644 RepID=UPI00208EF693|nr:MmcQ/YjbR family DNA-binding protein [Aeromonas hydrophila]MCO4201234.1 MmcQ/YjbR family DNA-binding protein [Aeromonas hydrophila]